MRLAGVFSERDLVKAVAEHGARAMAFSVEKLMTTPVATCRSTDKVESALAAMTVAKIRHLPVVDGGQSPPATRPSPSGLRGRGLVTPSPQRTGAPC
jgi:CBS domain-containing protein